MLTPIERPESSPLPYDNLPMRSVDFGDRTRKGRPVEIVGDRGATDLQPRGPLAELETTILGAAERRGTLATALPFAWGRCRPVHDAALWSPGTGSRFGRDRRNLALVYPTRALQEVSDHHELCRGAPCQLVTRRTFDLAVEARAYLACRNSRHDLHAPPVGGVRHPLRVPAAFESVQHRRHCPGGETALLCEFASGDPPTPVEKAQTTKIGAVEPKLLSHRLVELVPRAPQLLQLRDDRVRKICMRTTLWICIRHLPRSVPLIVRGHNNLTIERSHYYTAAAVQDDPASARDEETTVNAIEARELVKTYRGDVRALSGVSLAVEAGTVFGLLGPNGAGKSTTVKILTTLSRPDSGEALVAGHDVVREAVKVRHAIGCVAQKSGLDLAATGRENLLLQGRIYGMRGSALRARAEDLLDRFGLGEAAGRTVRTYSGGMQRKLDVALGLMHRPQVLFLDEPTTGLDPEARADMWSEVARLAGDEGLTILLTTHYLEEADRLAQRLAIIDRGRVVAEGTPEALKAELHGDAIVVELADGSATDDVVLASLGGVTGLRDVQLEAGVLRSRASNGARAVPAVLAALDTAGVVVASVGVTRPSLDDVYLRHTGRAFAQADQEKGS